MNTQFKYISSSLIIMGVCAAATLSVNATPVNGSLWTSGANNERSMFSDKVATQIGDILTIDVSESSSLASKVKMSTSKESTVKNDFTKLLFSDLLTRNGETPSTDLTLDSNTHEGSGSLANSHNITAQISVQVVDVLPNGNLVLEGVRVLTYSGETYYMLTQGVCRAADVTTANIISSSQIADARIEVVAEGSLTEAERMGWMARMANKVAP